DRRADLRHDLLSGNVDAERGRPNCDDGKTVSMLEQDDSAGPACAVESTRAGDGGAGQRIADDHQLEIGDARDLDVALEVLRSQSSTHRAVEDEVGAGARLLGGHAHEGRLAVDAEPGDTGDNDRVDARRSVLDGQDDRRWT